MSSSGAPRGLGWFDGKNLFAFTEGFIVDAVWYRDWMVVLGDVNPENIAKAAPTDQGTVFPKFRSLSNRALVEDGKLKQGLKEKHDFFAVSPALWAELVYHYRARPAIPRHRVASPLGELATVQHPIYLKLPDSIKSETQLITSMDFSLRWLKFTLCALLSRPPHKTLLAVARIGAEMEEVFEYNDKRTVQQAQISSGDTVMLRDLNVQPHKVH